MASKVDICNSALAKLGCDRINSLTDDNVRAKLCNDRYEIIKKEVLRSAPWKFALKRASLAKTVNTPAFEYESEFQLPSDCLRPWETFPNNISWTQEQDKILANEGELNIKYIYEAPEAKFDASFVEVLALRLAMDLCYKLTNSTSREQELRAVYTVMLADARSFSAQSSQTETYISEDFTIVRY